MPAPASLSIPGLVDQMGGLELPDPITVAAELRTALAQVTDPRKPRGVRHGLVVVLTTAVCAVAAGARSFVAIAEWVADLPATVAERWAPTGAARRSRRSAGWSGASTPTGSTPRSPPSSRQRSAALAPPGRRRALAVDGKTLRGSRSHRHRTVEQPARHLLAVIDHHTRIVLGQVRVEGKTNEITAFAPLLDTLTSLDLTGVVITADALHTQREHVETCTNGARTGC